MNLTGISFPVYKLGYNYSPSREGEVVFYCKQYKDRTVVEIVDDTSLKGNLPTRRLQLAMNKDVVVHELRKAVFFIGDLIKLAKPTVWFIDNNGKVFRYAKKRMVPLVFKRISHTVRTPGSTLIYVEGLPFAVKSLFPPENNEKYAGLLLVAPCSYILYGFYDTLHEDCLRKI
jgi:hypothetical protein